MRIMSLKQFMQQTRETQDDKPHEILAMTVREFLDAIDTQCEDNCTAVVTLNSPETNSITVKFLEQGEEPECKSERLRDRFRFSKWQR